MQQDSSSAGAVAKTATFPATAPTKGDLLDQRAAHRRVLDGLTPFVWPQGRPDLRRRVLLAFVMLVAAKLVTVTIPVVFKAATDWLTQPGEWPDKFTLLNRYLRTGVKPPFLFKRRSSLLKNSRDTQENTH